MIRKIQGEVTLHLTLTAAGDVVVSAIARSSGHDVLDHEVLAMVRRAAPFPLIPEETDGGQFEFYVPIDFTLE